MKKFGMMIVVLMAALFVQAASVKVHPDTRFGGSMLVTVKAADFTESATNTAETLTLSVLAKEGYELMAMELVSAFDTANTNYTGSLAVTVGDGTDADLYLTSTELASDGSEVWLKFAPVTTVTATSTGDATTNMTVTVTSTEMGRKVYTADDTIDFTFTPNAEEALDENIRGEVRFWLRKL